MSLSKSLVRRYVRRIVREFGRREWETDGYGRSTGRIFLYLYEGYGLYLSVDEDEEEVKVGCVPSLRGYRDTGKAFVTGELTSKTNSLVFDDNTFIHGEWEDVLEELYVDIPDIKVRRAEGLAWIAKREEMKDVIEYGCRYCFKVNEVGRHKHDDLMIFVYGQSIEIYQKKKEKLFFFTKEAGTLVYETRGVFIDGEWFERLYNFLEPKVNRLKKECEQEMIRRSLEEWCKRRDLDAGDYIKQIRDE